MQCHAGCIGISAQNHNYAVDPKTLPEGVEVTYINLNDDTCAGMVWPAKRAMAIPYHPGRRLLRAIHGHDQEGTAGKRQLHELRDSQLSMQMPVRET